MDDATDPLAFPDLPDAAVVALHRCLEDLSTAFENRFFAQLHRCYHPCGSRRPVAAPRVLTPTLTASLDRLAKAGRSQRRGTAQQPLNAAT
jgi:hypothetical protein